METLKYEVSNDGPNSPTVYDARRDLPVRVGEIIRTQAGLMKVVAIDKPPTLHGTPGHLYAEVLRAEDN